MTVPRIDSSLLLLITGDGMGRGDSVLRRKSIDTYLFLLDENNMLPGTICFYTDGVKLVVEGSSVLDSLRTFESKGVRLIICKTCLDHYGLTDNVQVGKVGGMMDIITAQWEAKRVITL
jgi:sulfur relay (sulfurtransferase) complex TusBCD TusD component (DsrE family)